MKTCQVCLHSQPDAAETCSECGEASWLVLPPQIPVPRTATRDTDPPAAVADAGDERARRVGKGR
jgi:hypothetical protein